MGQRATRELHHRVEMRRSPVDAQRSSPVSAEELSPSLEVFMLGLGLKRCLMTVSVCMSNWE